MMHKTPFPISRNMVFSALYESCKADESIIHAIYLSSPNGRNGVPLKTNGTPHRTS